MNKSEHRKVEVVDEETASKLVNSPLFSGLEELSDKCFEVIISSNYIECDLRSLNRLKSPLNEFFCTLNGDFASGIVEKTFDPSQPADPDRVLCLLICEA